MFDLEERTERYEKGLAIALGEDREFPRREVTKCIAAISECYDFLFEQKRFFVTLKDPEPHKNCRSEVFLRTGRNRSRKG